MIHLLFYNILNRNIMKIIYTFLFYLLCITIVKAQSISPERKVALLDSIANNPSGKVYFFDGVEISEVEFYDKAYSGELNGLEGTGVNSKRKSIERYGEYYRHGVTFFSSSKSIDMIKVKAPSIAKNSTMNVSTKKDLLEDSYHIKGTADKVFENKPIMLFSFDDDNIISVDTALVVNGKFEFIGKENPSNIGVISIGNHPDTIASLVVFLDKGNIEADMSSGRVGGTHLNDLYQGYFDTSLTLHNELSKVHSEEDGRDENAQGLYLINGSPRHKKVIEIGEYTVGFKKDNIHNIVGQYLFEKEIGKNLTEMHAYPNTESCPDSSFYIIYNEADENYKQRDWIKEYLKDLKYETKLIKKNNHLDGKQFIDFTLTDLIRESKQLSDYIGKSRYILLDFWASWCGPCIASFPKLKEVYNKYDRDDLEIIGVSIDTNNGSWINAVTKQQLPWIQLATLNSSLNDEVQEKYAFQGIPHTVLLDDKGKIIASKISISELNEFIENKL